MPSSAAPARPQGRRETAKAERRDAILDAMLARIDRPAADGQRASIETIARDAGVAPATVYNLFGTRDAILANLVRRMAADILDGRDTAQPDHQHQQPIGSLLSPIDLVCEQFRKRPRAWSHIILRLGDIAATTPVEESNGRDFSAILAAQWQATQTSGVVQPEFSPHVFALQTYATANGALMRWAAGRISVETLRLLLRQTILLIATAAATESHAPALIEELLQTSTQLAAALEETQVEALGGEVRL